MKDILLKEISVTPPEKHIDLLHQTVEGIFKLFHLSPVGMILTDQENGTCVEVNELFLRTFEFSREEILGITLGNSGLLNAEEIQRLREIRANKGKIQNEELSACTKTGKRLHCIVSSEIISVGHKQYSLSAFHNVTVIKEQENIIGKQHREIMGSIHYAKHIQDALFPPQALLGMHLPQSFVLYKPKAIVSGDFYWIEQIGSKIYIAVADCTGHGVPGAFMSIIGYNLLSKCIKSRADARPDIILNELNNGVQDTLRQTQGSVVRDGMDVALCSIDIEKKQLEYAGAFNPLYLVRDGSLIKLLADRFPIGFFLNNHSREFTHHQEELKKGDILYLFSDGYPDQFGGPNGKKFMHRRLQDLIISIRQLPMEDQKIILDRTIEDWKGNEEQTDDILVIGIKI